MIMQLNFPADGVELTRMNGPRDKVYEWFIEPLLIMKEQIKGLQLDENEEICLRELVMRGRNEKPEEWDDTEFASSDNVRRAQLQSIIRRYIFNILSEMDQVFMSFPLEINKTLECAFNPKLLELLRENFSSSISSQYYMLLEHKKPWP
jgi:hypothetical protein